jgi:hypothetical protein
MGADTDALEPALLRIGEAAGVVWSYLHKKGKVPLTKLIDDVDLSRDLLMQAIGWLARENKLQFSETSRRKMVALRPE